MILSNEAVYERNFVLNENIKVLPEHAQYQRQGKTWYVYFPYCFSINGKREQERDCIGTLSPDGREFLPNLYYVQEKPIFEGNIR